MRKIRKIRKKIECQHKWIPLLGRVGRKNIPTSLFTCLKCGEMKVGTHTIRISRYRLDMGGHPIYAGNIELAENAGLVLDPVLSADGKYTGITITGTAGATLAFGDLIYLDPTDSRWELADANAAAAADGDARGILGICVLAAAVDGDATAILLHGVVRADTAFPILTVGAPAYVSETAGDVVVAQPTTTDAVIRIVGIATTTDVLFFNPDNIYYTHT